MTTPKRASAQAAEAALVAREEWGRWHRLWLDGALSTDSLLAYAFVHKDCPAAWLWAMTIMEIRMHKPSNLTVITGV